MRILCIGDSNTWGYHPGVGLRHEKRWTRLLKDWFPEERLLRKVFAGGPPYLWILQNGNARH